MVAISGHRIPYYADILNIWIPLTVCQPLVWHIYIYLTGMQESYTSESLIINQPSLRPKNMVKHGQSLNICDKLFWSFFCLEKWKWNFHGKEKVFWAPIVNVCERRTNIVVHLKWQMWDLSRERHPARTIYGDPDIESPPPLNHYWTMGWILAISNILIHWNSWVVGGEREMQLKMDELGAV